MLGATELQLPADGLYLGQLAWVLQKMCFNSSASYKLVAREEGGQVALGVSSRYRWDCIRVAPAYGPPSFLLATRYWQARAVTELHHWGVEPANVVCTEADLAGALRSFEAGFRLASAQAAAEGFPTLDVEALVREQAASS